MINRICVVSKRTGREVVLFMVCMNWLIMYFQILKVVQISMVTFRMRPFRKKLRRKNSPSNVSGPGLCGFSVSQVGLPSIIVPLERTVPCPQAGISYSRRRVRKLQETGRCSWQSGCTGISVYARDLFYWKQNLRSPATIIESTGSPIQ